MSKLAYLREARGVAGDPAFPLIGAIGSLIGKGLGALGIKTGAALAAKKAAQLALKLGPSLAAGALGAKLLKGKPAAEFGFRRRAKGITGTELRGFRKVNRLLCTVGMTPKRISKRRPC